MAQKHRLLRGIGAALLTLFGASFASGTPSMAQYCVDAWNAHGPRFCMALSMYHNHSTAAHDMYLTIQVHRPANADKASLGWLAVGSGPAMSGSLMFLVYGDPITGKGPFVSGRGISLGRGHAQPHVLSQDDAGQNGGGVLVQQLGVGRWSRAGDKDDDSDHVGVAQLVCYGCDGWDGHPFEPDATSLSMIWAFNEKQDMAPYAWDQPLDKHVGVGGHGTFYTNMVAASTHAASGPPAILPGAENNKVNTAGHRISVPKPTVLEQLKARPAAYAHASAMLLAFLVLFPLGVAGIRSSLDAAFRYHWRIQVGAIALATVGAGLGLSLLSSSSGGGGLAPGSVHEKVGLSVCGLLFAQAASGWWHHVRFLRVWRRTWVSYAHMALGWAILLGGWTNALTGARLYGVGRLTMSVLAVLIGTELLVLTTMAWVWHRKKQRDRDLARPEWQEEGNFVLGDMESDDDETERKSSEKLQPAKYHK